MAHNDSRGHEKQQQRGITFRKLRNISCDMEGQGNVYFRFREHIALELVRCEEEKKRN